MLIAKTLALGALPRQRLDKAERLPVHFSAFSRYGCNRKHWRAQGLVNGPTPLFQATAAATVRKTEVTVLPEPDNARYLGTYVDDLGTPPLGTSCKVVGVQVERRQHRL